MAYLDKHQLLHSNQHGFRKRLSCETQLIQFVQDISDTLNESGQTDIIVMDFSKAFDKVDHKRLLLKLYRFGINMMLSPGLDPFFQTKPNELCLKVRSLISVLSCLVCHRVLCWDPVCFFCI